MKNAEPRTYLNPVLNRMMKQQGVYATARHMAKLGYPIYMALHTLRKAGAL